MTKTLYEQIFDRRCSAAAVGNEVDVRFFDELLGDFAEFDSIREESEKELSQLEQKIDELEEYIKELEEINDEVRAKEDD